MSNVKTMEYMFMEHTAFHYAVNGCEEFTADLSQWNVSNVEDTDSMFYECCRFVSDLSSWDASKVTNNVWDTFCVP